MQRFLRKSHFPPNYYAFLSTKHDVLKGATHFSGRNVLSFSAAASPSVRQTYPAQIHLFRLFILSHWERLWLSRRLSNSCTHRVLLCAAGQWLFISLLPETPLWTALSSLPPSWEPAQLVRSLLHKHPSSDQQHTGKSRMQLDVSVTPAQERLLRKDPWSSLVSQTSQLVSSRFRERWFKK